MKCFYHPEIDAVGICKSCSKGICMECSVDLGKGIACKGGCEEEVKAINQMMERTKGVYKKTSGAYSSNSIIYLLLGVLLIIFGFISWNVGDLRYYTLPAGLIFLLGAIFNYNNAKKFKENGEVKEVSK